MRVWPGAPLPLGATWDGEGVNFAIFSEHAEGVQLLLFEEETASSHSTAISLTEKTDNIWHAYLPDVRPGALYGYRVLRSLRARAGASLQPEQAPDRPLCEGGERSHPLE